MRGFERARSSRARDGETTMVGPDDRADTPRVDGVPADGVRADGPREDLSPGTECGLTG